MNLKIIYRSAVIWNIILHFLLSLSFILLQNAIFQEKSVFNVIFLKSSLQETWPIVSLVLISSFLVYNLKKISYLVFLLTVLVVSIFSAYQLWLDFSKLVLLVLFVYILVSYYLSFLLKSDLEQAFYNPGFSENDLFDPMLMKIKVDVYEGDKEENKLTGFLTNWNEEGCFLKLEEKLPKKRSVKLVFHFRGHQFRENGVVTTLFKKNNGIGVKFSNIKLKQGWTEVFEIISDMGMNVEYIR